MDLESPEAVDILLRTIDANSKAIKDLSTMLKHLKEEVHALKDKVERLEKS